jgi:hypothetical protein
MIDQIKGQQFRMLGFWIVTEIFLFMVYAICMNLDGATTPGRGNISWLLLVFVGMPFFAAFLKKGAWSGVTMAVLLGFWVFQYVPVWNYLVTGLLNRFAYNRIADDYIVEAFRCVFSA